jgi:hypothetical protein
VVEAVARLRARGSSMTTAARQLTIVLADKVSSAEALEI